MSEMLCGYTETSKENLKEDMFDWLDRHLEGDFPNEVVLVYAFVMARYS